MPENRPPKQWPDRGHVEFSDYATRYRDGLNLVLKDINCDFRPAEKVKAYSLRRRDMDKPQARKVNNCNGC